MERRISTGVREVITNNPVWVLYIRQDPRIKCSCWSSSFGGSGKSCPLCFGLGNKVKIEKIPVRLSLNSRELKQENDNTLMGRVDQATMRAYTTAETSPKDDDLIVNVTWNKEPSLRDASPDGVIRVFSIQIAGAIQQSEISFYTLGLNPYASNIPEFTNALRNHTLYLGKY